MNLDNFENTDVYIEIKISAEALEYTSAFADSKTIFWLEAVKSIILKDSFDKTSLRYNILS